MSLPTIMLYSLQSNDSFQKNHVFSLRRYLEVFIEDLCHLEVDNLDSFSFEGIGLKHVVMFQMPSLNKQSVGYKYQYSNQYTKWKGSHVILERKLSSKRS